MNSLQTSTHLRLIGMAALWGASWPWGRVVAQNMPPLAAASLRFLLASAVLCVWLWRSGLLPELRSLRKRQWLGMGCAAAVGVLGYAVFFFLALQKVPAGKAAMVVALNPVLTLLFAAMLFRERVNALMCAGVVLAVGGALFALTGGDLEVLRPSRSEGSGEWLLLGCAACWVAYTLLGRLVLTTVGALTTTTMTAFIGAILLCGASSVIEGPGSWLRLSIAPAEAWYSLAALAWGATALAYSWYLSGVKVLGAGPAAAYMSLVPLFGMAFSSIWLGESLTTSLLIGGSLAIAGMLMMNVGRIRLHQPPKRMDR